MRGRAGRRQLQGLGGDAHDSGGDGENQMQATFRV